MKSRLIWLALSAAIAFPAPLLAQARYAEIPVLVVVYTNYYKDGDTYMHLDAQDVAVVQGEVEDAVKFFWRSSHLRCHVDLTWLVVERTLTPEQMWFWGSDGGCWLPWWSVDGQTSVRGDVLAAGYQSGDFTSVVALYAFENDDEVWQAIGGGSYGMNCGVLGPAGYVGASFAWGLEVEGLFTHEYLHQLDSVFAESGNPDDMFHADHAGSFPYPDDCMLHFNYLICSTLDQQSWLQLDPVWATVCIPFDDDADGVPDFGDLPITEASLGTSNSTGDTDADGTSDLEEITGVFYGMSDPLAEDSDGDLSRDGGDPYPLIKLSNPSIRHGRPTVNGSILPGEYTKLAVLDQWGTDIGATLYARWTEDTLYIAAQVVDQTVSTPFPDEPWWCDHLQIMIDSNGGHWFLDSVPGNYLIRVVPTGSNGNALTCGHDYYEDPDHDAWHEFDTSAIVARYSRALGYVLEVAIPLSVVPELDLQMGGGLRLGFGMVDIDEWEWPRYDVLTGLMGDCNGFVTFRLIPDTTTDRDIDGDGDIDGDDAIALCSVAGGPGVGAPPALPPRWFERSDHDPDGDVDLADYAVYSALLSAERR